MVKKTSFNRYTLTFVKNVTFHAKGFSKDIIWGEKENKKSKTKIPSQWK